MSRPWRGACLALIGAIAALAMGAATADAHAILLGTEPVDGAVLAEAPRQARLWFSESVLVDFTTIELVAGDGRRAPIASVQAGASDSGELVIDLPSLAPDAYRLSWQTLSSEDLHASSGSIVFGVQRAVETDARPSAAITPRPDEVALRWLNFGALAGLIGALALALWVVPEAAVDMDAPLMALETVPTPLLIGAVRRRLLWLALGACLLAVLAGLGLLLTQASAAIDTADLAALLRNAWQVVTQTEFGARWLMREGQLATLALVAWVTLARLRNRPTQGSARSADPRGSRRALEAARLATLPLILAAVTLHAMTSHAAGLQDTAPFLVAANALHVLAASLWVGGLFALALAIAPLLGHDMRARALAWTILRRFGVLAALSVAVLAITGLYAGGQLVASLDALLLTLYGQALLVKVGLALCVGWIGLFNSASLHPGMAAALGRVLRRPAGWTPLAPQHLRRTIRIEAAGAIAALLLAALLGATPPARGPEFDPPPEEAAAPQSITANAADLLVTLSIKPNRPGQNFVMLSVFNTRRPAPAPIETVAVQLVPPDGQRAAITLPADFVEEGRYQIAGGHIDAAGEWEISAIIRREGMADAVLSVPWMVMPAIQPAQRRPIVVSNRPLAPLLTFAALVIALGVGGTLFALWRRRDSSTCGLPRNWGVTRQPRANRHGERPAGARSHLAALESEIASAAAPPRNDGVV